MRPTTEGIGQAALVALVLVLPLPVQACSCRHLPADLATALTSARASAPHIYHARVVALRRRLLSRLAGRPWPDQAELVVREVFKGTTRAGQRLTVPAGGGGDCTLGFRVGEDVLVYSVDADPSSVFMCTRSRRASSSDLELAWLRTGVLPAPVAVRRRRSGRHDETCGKTTSCPEAWGPLLEPSSVSCDWTDPATPWCDFDGPQVLRPEGSPVYPLLECVPSVARLADVCRLLTAPAPP